MHNDVHPYSALLIYCHIYVFIVLLGNIPVVWLWGAAGGQGCASVCNVQCSVSDWWGFDIWSMILYFHTERENVFFVFFVFPYRYAFFQKQ